MAMQTAGSSSLGLATCASGTLSKQAAQLTVGALEHALLRDFPASDAEAWDRTGMTVGDPAKPVAKVAVALDATVACIHEAASLGANVLVTHHPAFLDAPDSFRPGASAAEASGAVVWAAIDSGVALLSFHTALDVSERATHMLPDLLGLGFTGTVLVPSAAAAPRGYGQLCEPRAQDAPLTLDALSRRCVSVFGRMPRVWGRPERELSRIATCTGSAGDVVDACLAAHVDCLVAGEVKYHAALDASQAGLAIIDLGHDVSELPFTGVLAQAVVRAGVDKGDVAIIDQRGNWSHPEATRL